MRNISIKWRMTLWFSLLMIAITALMLVFVMLMNRNTVTRPPEAELLYMVGRNADDVEFDHGGWDFSDVEQYAHGVYTEIFDEDGQQLFGTAPAEVSDGAPKERNALHTVVGSSGGTYLVYDRWLEIGGSGLWVRGTIDSAARGSVMEVIVPLAWSVLPALVVLSVGGGWLISSSSFKPMEKVIAAAESISGGEDLSRRIGLPRGRSEINRLAGTFDDMFDRLERSFKAEAQFTSDASHELRTPVTVILAECETLERTAETTEDYVEGMTVIHRQAEQMSRLIGQLLHITRLEQGTQKTCMERGDLTALAEAVCEQQKMIAPEGVVLAFDGPESVEAQMDVILMTRLLNNLISNAFRYGSDGGHVRVTVRREAEQAVLTVRMTARASRRTSRKRYGSASIRWTRPAAAARAPGWGCTWYARSHGSTAVRRRWRACPGRAAHSPCGSRRNDIHFPRLRAGEIFSYPLLTLPWWKGIG